MKDARNIITTHQEDNINRRIKTMNYQEETNVREYLTYEFSNYQKDCEMFMLYDNEARDIAEMLEVNETCIFDILVDLGFASYEEEEN
jgi:hypothetical protein